MSNDTQFSKLLINFIVFAALHLLIIVSNVIAQVSPICNHESAISLPLSSVNKSASLPLRNNIATRAQYELSGEAAKKIVPEGENIVLQLTLKNLSPNVIFIIQSDTSTDYNIEVKGANEKLIALSAKGQEALSSPAWGSRMLIQIPPGEASCRPPIVVNELYALPKGRYTIVVKQFILMQDKKTYTTIKSNPIIVNIADATQFLSRPKKIELLLGTIQDKGLQEKEPEQVVKAIFKLGELQAKEAIAPLIGFLTFKRFEPENGTSETHIITPAGTYPAIGALSSIGEPALPALLQVIETTEANDLASQNAVETVLLIFREDPQDAISYLKLASTKTIDEKAKQRILQAVRKADERLQLFLRAKARV